MEESANELEPDQQLNSQPRRRSTFFERRESFVLQPISEILNVSTSRKATEDEEKRTDILSFYHDSLLKEKEQWKKEVSERRNKYHDLRQQYQMALKGTGKTRISYSPLSNADIEYLKSKANVSKFADSQLKLHKALKETLAMYKKIYELDNIILNRCEAKVGQITEHIFEHSTLEPITDRVLELCTEEPITDRVLELSTVEPITEQILEHNMEPKE